MALFDAQLGKTGLLKLAVHIACVDESAVSHPARPALQDSEACMRRGVAVELEAVAVETPGQTLAGEKAGAVGDVLELVAVRLERRIGPPEAAFAAKVGQAGVDTHAGARADDHAIGFAYPGGGALQFFSMIHVMT